MVQLHNDLGDSASDSNQYLLSFDRGEHGRAIVSDGNPDTAENVVTMIPGTNTTMKSITGQMDYAGSVAAEADRRGDEGATAVISWIGYDAPEDKEAVSDNSAENATADLSTFQDGLRATHEGTTPSHNSVIGHSYGSTVLGHTATSEHGLDADELILVGSPGTSVDNAHELGFAPENVHSTTAENDHINAWWVAVHGQDPTSEEFGATTFDSNPGPATGGYFFGDAHKQDEYFKEIYEDEELDHDPLTHIGGIIVGNNPATDQ